MRTLCLECKGGRLLCGRESCPAAKIHIQSLLSDSKKTMFGPSSPSLFRGWMGYLMSLSGHVSLGLKTHRIWTILPMYGADFNEYHMRSNLARSKTKEHSSQTRGLCWMCRNWLCQNQRWRKKRRIILCPSRFRSLWPYRNTRDIRLQESENQKVETKWWTTSWSLLNPLPCFTGKFRCLQI